MSNVCRQHLCNLPSFSMTEKHSRLPTISSLSSMLHTSSRLNTSECNSAPCGQVRNYKSETRGACWLFESCLQFTFPSTKKGVWHVHSGKRNSKIGLWIAVALIFKYLLTLRALITSHWRNVVLSLIADLWVACLTKALWEVQIHAQRHTHT